MYNFFLFVINKSNKLYLFIFRKKLTIFLISDNFINLEKKKEEDQIVMKSK